MVQKFWDWMKSLPAWKRFLFNGIFILGGLGVTMIAVPLAISIYLKIHGV